MFKWNLYDFLKTGSRDTVMAILGKAGKTGHFMGSILPIHGSYPIRKEIQLRLDRALAVNRTAGKFFYFCKITPFAYTIPLRVIFGEIPVKT